MNSESLINKPQRIWLKWPTRLFPTSSKTTLSMMLLIYWAMSISLNKLKFMLIQVTSVRYICIYLPCVDIAQIKTSLLKFLKTFMILQCLSLSILLPSDSPSNLTTMKKSKNYSINALMISSKNNLPSMLPVKKYISLTFLNKKIKSFQIIFLLNSIWI